MKLIEALEQSQGLLVGGHRGHLSQVRENTIPNFEEVCGRGIAHIEIDVQLTGDDQVVIYHDLNLAERSPLTGRIYDYTLAQLQAAFEINTVDEVLAWARPREQLIAIEIKTQHLFMQQQVQRLGERLVELLEKHDFQDYSFVFSTDYSVLKRIKTADPRVNLGLIVPFVPADPVKLMQEMDAIIYLCYFEGMSEDIVQALHSAGYYADGSVVNDRERLELALKLGVDLIESDHPEEILRILKEGGANDC